VNLMQYLWPTLTAKFSLASRSIYYVKNYPDISDN
jgi:hypothetical protein